MARSPVAPQAFLVVNLGKRHLAKPRHERKKSADWAEPMAPSAQNRQLQDDDCRKDQQANRRLVEPYEPVDRYGGRERQPNRADQAKYREPAEERRAKSARQNHVATIELDAATPLFWLWRDCASSKDGSFPPIL